MDTAVALNSAHLLWQGSAYWSQMRKAMSRYCKVAKNWDVLFQYFHDSICNERNDTSPDTGSESHCKRVFESLANDAAFACLGPRVQLTRWGSWHRAMLNFDT